MENQLIIQNKAEYLFKISIFMFKQQENKVEKRNNINTDTERKTNINKEYSELIQDLYKNTVKGLYSNTVKGLYKNKVKGLYKNKVKGLFKIQYRKYIYEQQRLIICLYKHSYKMENKY